MADWTPQSRAEEILFNTINGEPYDGLPQSRIEELLLELKDVIESGGGGGGGTDNYNLLKNLPQINGQTVKGNMSGTTLGLVNMVMGKDLSTNDYTNADKAIVNSVTADLADKVDKITGKGLSANDYTNADKAIVDGVTSALAGKADVGDIPTKTSDLTNDSGFITNLVNNLLNYYLKTETYSKTEVDALLQAITTLDIQAVSQLPTTNISTTTIYLVPKQSLSSQDVKDEYINLDGTTSGWELIGNTQIDLSNYVTTSDLTTALADYVTSEQFSKEFFIGTQAVWNSLTVSQKTEYTFAVITDDYDDNPVGNLNALTTTDKSSCVGAINEVNDGLSNIMKVPDQGADVLGYGAKDGANAVTVNLGSNDIRNYDFLEFMISYYESGVACYGYINVPIHTMHYIFGGDAGVPMFVTTTVNSTGAIRVVLTGNSNVKFSPDNGIEPLGNYYVVRGVKLRK